MIEEPVIGRLSGMASALATGQATLSATYDPTQRGIVCDAENYGPAREWATSPEPALHSAVARFLDDLSRAPVFGVTLTCFRGRQAMEPPQNMGPPPDCHAKSGRYNYDGKSVLYLADSEQGVIAELLAHGCMLPIWAQRFVISGSIVRFADFRSNTTIPFLNCVFWFSELAGIEEQHVTYDFSQLVGDLVAKQFEGMIVPGVRGGHGFTYSNVVVFNPFSHVHHWTAMVEGGLCCIHR